jgi:branched-chain amino acid transport system substrate-binding protein
MANVLPANDPQRTVVMGYNKAYKDRFTEDPSTFGGYALDALMLAGDAIKRAGSIDHERVREALEQTKGLVGTTGTFNLSPTDHLGLDLSAFRMLEVKNGNWAFVP